MTKRVFAFWCHDTFPYLLGGEVSDISENGRVETVEYGRGFWFQPVFILPLEKGRQVLKDLGGLRVRHDDALSEIRGKFYEERNEYLAKKGIPYEKNLKASKRSK